MESSDWNLFDDPNPDLLGQVVALLKRDTANIETEYEELSIAARQFDDWINNVVQTLLENDSAVFEEQYLEKNLNDHCRKCSSLAHEVVSALESVFADEKRTFAACDRILTADPSLGLPLTYDLELTFSNAQVLVEKVTWLLESCIDSIRLIVHPHRTSKHETSFKSSLGRLYKHSNTRN